MVIRVHASTAKSNDDKIPDVGYAMYKPFFQAGGIGVGPLKWQVPRTTSSNPSQHDTFYSEIIKIVIIIKYGRYTSI
jgi:hypothetical protein